MTFKAERIEVLGVNVHDLERARDVLGSLLGLDFTVFDVESQSRTRPIALKSGSLHSDGLTLTGAPRRLAIDDEGFFELIESGADSSDDGMRNIHFKVDDIDAAIAAAQDLGIMVVANLRAGGLREAILDSGDLFGVRLCFVEYSAPTLVEAIQAEDPGD